MCVEATPPPSARVTRRGVLAGAAALACTLAAAGPAAGPAAASTAGETHPAPSGPRPHGGNLVIRGGTLLDPHSSASASRQRRAR
ncbi:hypothetical protein AB0E66_17190 [Streptomyces sp. NPDC033753]|uniref:hypothetical protein n=1 Tax=Streptomyces sp. NPDC033753 TaxID=3155128 RepID=UPI0033E1F9D5